LIAAANLVYFICFALIQLEMQLHMSVDIYIVCMYMPKSDMVFFSVGPRILRQLLVRKLRSKH